MSNHKIIATIGDVSGLSLGDMGKRPFVRLGAPADNPYLPQGTIHITDDHIHDSYDDFTLYVFERLGIRLRDGGDGTSASQYYPTGAVLYEPAGVDGLSVLASVKMAAGHTDPEAAFALISVVKQIDGAYATWLAVDDEDDEDDTGPTGVHVGSFCEDATRAELLRLAELMKAEEMGQDESDEFDRLICKYPYLFEAITVVAGRVAEPELAFAQA